MGRWWNNQSWKPFPGTQGTQTWSGVASMDSHRGSHAWWTWTPAMKWFCRWGKSTGDSKKLPGHHTRCCIWCWLSKSGVQWGLGQMNQTLPTSAILWFQVSVKIWEEKLSPWCLLNSPRLCFNKQGCIMIFPLYSCPSLKLYKQWGTVWWKDFITDESLSSTTLFWVLL